MESSQRRDKGQLDSAESLAGSFASLDSAITLPLDLKFPRCGYALSTSKRWRREATQSSVFHSTKVLYRHV